MRHAWEWWQPNIGLISRAQGRSKQGTTRAIRRAVLPRGRDSFVQGRSGQIEREHRPVAIRTPDRQFRFDQEGCDESANTLPLVVRFAPCGMANHCCSQGKSARSRRLRTYSREWGMQETK